MDQQFKKSLLKYLEEITSIPADYEQILKADIEKIKEVTIQLINVEDPPGITKKLPEQVPKPPPIGRINMTPMMPRILKRN